METVNFGYSMKNISIPDGKSYKLQLIQKVADFFKKIRWKAIFFMIGGNQTDPTIHKPGLTFSINSANSPLQLKKSLPFEEDLIIRKVDDKFQRALAEDLEDIRS